MSKSLKTLGNQDPEKQKTKHQIILYMKLHLQGQSEYFAIGKIQQISLTVCSNQIKCRLLGEPHRTELKCVTILFKDLG